MGFPLRGRSNDSENTLMILATCNLCRLLGPIVQSEIRYPRGTLKIRFQSIQSFVNFRVIFTKTIDKSTFPWVFDHDISGFNRTIWLDKI